MNIIWIKSLNVSDEMDAARKNVTNNGVLLLQVNRRHSELMTYENPVLWMVSINLYVDRLAKVYAI